GPLAARSPLEREARIVCRHWAGTAGPGRSIGGSPSELHSVAGREDASVARSASTGGGGGAVALLVGGAPAFRTNPRRDRSPGLKKLVVDREDECAQAVATYQPATKGLIDADLLRQLPGVAQVEGRGRPAGSNTAASWLRSSDKAP